VTCHTDYHQAQKILLLGQGGKGVSHPMPNIMLEKGLSCKGCHIFHEEKGGRVIKSETFVSKNEACESCHGKGFARIMKDWEVSTDKKLSRIRSIYRKAANELNLTKNANKEKARQFLEEAAFNIDIVERGKSVHNVEYSQELLSASYNKIVEALRTIGSAYKPEPSLAVAKEVPTQCYNCHAGIEEIDKQIFGLDFPHKNHLIEQKIKCSNCHSNVRKHGEFVATKQSCALCHHKDTKKNCTGCHQLQKAIYEGGELNSYDIPADIMFEAKASCTDCHLGPENQIVRSEANKCLDCHDEEYGEIFTEWQNSVKELIDSVKASLKEKRKLTLSSEDKAQLLHIEKTLQKIELDGSSGVHNYSFVEETLTNLEKILTSLGKRPSG